MDTQRTAPTYLVTCLYGLEGVLVVEVADRLGVPADHRWCEATFTFDGPPGRLAGLRTAGNVFLRLDRFPIGGAKADLGELAARLRAVSLDRWQECAEELVGHELGDVAVSVTVSRQGEHKFTYKDVEELALDVLGTQTSHKVGLDPHPLEFRVDIHEGWCRLLGRLTPTPLSERAYRLYRGSFETEPALAASMIRLGRMASDDAFLDPFCGTGVIPIERALAGPAGLLVAGELKPKRLAWAAANAQAAGAPVALLVEDADALPFAARTFSRIVTDPPQSDPVTGRPWRVEQFAHLVQECFRVLRYGGAMTWLMQKGSLFTESLKLIGGMPRATHLACSWKGRPWTIYHVEKPL
jgi:23S rRNA G2445 N2-methylase RlmL